MPKFYTSVNLLINQSKQTCEKQFSVLGSKGGHFSPLMHVPLYIIHVWHTAFSLAKSHNLVDLNYSGCHYKCRWWFAIYAIKTQYCLKFSKQFVRTFVLPNFSNVYYVTCQIFAQHSVVLFILIQPRISIVLLRGYCGANDLIVSVSVSVFIQRRICYGIKCTCIMSKYYFIIISPLPQKN